VAPLPLGRTTVESIHDTTNKMRRLEQRYAAGDLSALIEAVWYVRYHRWSIPDWLHRGLADAVFSAMAHTKEHTRGRARDVMTHVARFDAVQAMERAGLKRTHAEAEAATRLGVDIDTIHKSCAFVRKTPHIRDANRVFLRMNTRGARRRRAGNK
jgi:hypothetical protein